MNDVFAKTNSKLAKKQNSKLIQINIHDCLPDDKWIMKDAYLNETWFSLSKAG